MDRTYCQRVDDEALVEKYVAGHMDDEERVRFEQHLQECTKHAKAVNLERAIKRGISDFARSQLRDRLRESIHKKESIRFYTLRYAAILFFVVITPLMLYYQFYMPRTATITSEQAIPPGIDQPSAPAEPADEMLRVPDIEKSTDVQVVEDLERPEPLTRQSPVEEQIESEAPSLDAEIESALESRVPDHRMKSLESRAAAQRVSGMAKVQSDASVIELLQQKMEKCLDKYEGILQLEHILVTYTFRIDTSGFARDISLIEINAQSQLLDQCFQDVLSNWNFGIPSADSTIKRTFKLSMD